MRLVAYRLRFFCMTGWRWNWFDAVLVTMQVFEEITMIVARVSLTDSDTEGGGNLSFLRVLRILRLVRVVRLARVLRLVRQLRTLVTSIGASLQSLAWTVMLIVFIIYVVGIYFTQLVTNERIGATAAELDSQNMQMMARYFGTLERSCLSLFQSISGGVSWEIILSPLVEDVSWLVAPLFTLYIAFSLLAMMNVVTGVFVESALQSSAEDKEEFFASQLLELIMQHGENDDGYLWAHVLEGMVANPETAQRLAALDIKKAEALNLFKLIDIERTGVISITSFIQACLRLRGAARSIDVTTMMFEQKRFLKEWQAHAARMEELVVRLTPADPAGSGAGSLTVASAASAGALMRRGSSRGFPLNAQGRALHSLEHFVGRS
uniref:EF-hand domain-containing protein n=1 Tax=Pyrodinium bahamense TaxID=73915 RepID=A0A7S0FNW2_9DINO